MLNARAACSVSCWLLICALAACQVYDGGLLPPSSSPDASMLMTDTGAGNDATVCVPQVEICNGIDDDCNGLEDENSASVQEYCASRVMHAISVCQSGRCVYLRECDVGYYNCDGHPENGCEAACPCQTGCVDGGSEDAGVDGDSG